MSKKKPPVRLPKQLMTNLAYQSVASQSGDVLLHVETSQIRPNPHQPRKIFDPETIDELAASIREHGILEPLIGQEASDGTYTLIAGERRWRAAQALNLSRVPMVLRGGNQTTDTGLLALVENLQRADLHPVEEVQALARIVEQCATQEEAARLVGFHRSTLARLIRPAGLEAEVLDLCLTIPGVTRNTLAKLMDLPTLAARLAFLEKFKPKDPAVEVPKRQPPTKVKPNQFRFSQTQPGASFQVEVKYRKRDASLPEIIAALELALAEANRQATEKVSV
ncbi:MAG TPA: ParB/RepB/Spo0J family partition protein [Acidobacteriota bacterium]|nr:ParB/RepB/Spo0J family partition protein [Acidobacteriota bacterium]HNH83640.1 ParB/RepB/Spo0J family partition protein [Acidobacteriota bacterium]HNJ40006.1 ParB/RepB/Spo0J family partition protein [Acidobacteriota bacterium]